LSIGSRVLAVEPQARCADLIEQRYHPNRKLTVLRVGVHSECGVAPFFVRKQDWLSGFVEKWEGHTDHVEEVEIVTLDLLIATYGLPDYVKIDVEGLESEVLSGLSHPIRLLSYEYHMLENGIDTATQCVNRLAKLGEVRINVTGSEEHRFAFAEWFTHAELPDRLLSLREDKVYRFGEIFVEIV
jgi:FkbM family methyltransferase